MSDKPQPTPEEILAQVADPSGRFDFTQDWTRQFRRNTEEFFKPFFANRPDQPPIPAPINYLEVGVFEGRSGCHILDTYPDLRYTGIDLWETQGLSPVYYPTGDDAVINAIEARARKNLGWYQEQGREVGIMKGQATRCLSELLESGVKFDFIYIDAAHFALNVVAEAAISWQMLKIGGLMLFDDYKDRGSRNTTLSGGEAFLSLVHHKRLFQNHQLGVIKTREADLQPVYRAKKLGV